MDQLLTYLPQVRKAIVGAVAALLLTWLGLIGVHSDTSVTDALTAVGNALFTGLTIWLVPNAKQGK